MTRKTTQAEVAKILQSNSILVLESYVNSQTPLKCQCLICGNIIFPRLDKIKSFGHQCGYCSGRINPGKKAEEFVKKLGHTPLEPYKNALTPWKMTCGFCGKTISPKYNSLQQGQFGCKPCGNIRSGTKRREVGSEKAIQILRKAGCEPLEPYPGSNVPWRSRCMKCDSLIQPRLGAIQSGQGGCRKCGIKTGAKLRMHTEEQARIIAKKKNLEPLEPYSGNNKRWKCQCLKCGKISNPYFSAIRIGKYGCLWCAKKIVDPVEARKKMVSAGVTPLVSYPGSDKGWLSKCKKCGREVMPTYGSIRSGQGGCKWCKLVAAKVDPTIAVQTLLAQEIQPLEPFKSSHSKWKSRCLRCGNEVSPTYHDISQGSGGCKYCAPNFVNEKRINLVMKRADFEPQENYPGSKAPWRVKHIKCGRVFEVEYANIRKAGSCRYCAGVAVIPNEAVAFMRNLGLKPLIPYPGGKKKWKCRCLVCKRTIYPTYSSILSQKSGCNYCSGSRVDARDAKKLMIENGLKPLEPFPGAVKKWKCRCEACKRIVTPMYTSIQRGQGGCRYCANWGIDYGAKGYLYLMTNRELFSHKLGIGNSSENPNLGRIKQHEKRGWKLYKKMDFEVTDNAYNLEQKVLKWLREEKQLRIYLSEFEMPQGGYSETVDAEEIDLPTIWAKVEEFSKVNE